MKQKEQVWWVAAAVLSLAAFSFFAGLGLRGLVRSLSGSPSSAASGASRYPQLASAGGRVLEPDIKPAQLYASVLQKLKLYYVEPTPPDTVLAYGSVDYMLNELKDPNTRLLGKVEMDALQSEEGGVYPGLGAVLTIRRYSGRKEEAADAARDEKETPSGVRTVTVVAVAPGGPAEKAGLQAGDRITELDGHWIAPTHISYRLLTQLTDPLGPQDGRPLEPDEKPESPLPSTERDKARKEADEARSRWKNSTDLPSALQDMLRVTGEHELTFERGTPSQTRKVRVVLGSTKVDPFSSRVVGDAAGYVRMLSFNDTTARKASAALGEFQQKGLRNLVIDLRQNAGGNLDAVVEVAGLLLGDKKLAVLKERDAQRRLVDRGVFAKGSVRFRPEAVTVLVDGGTAGTAELLAAALRDQLGARLVGASTFGDGSSQDVIRLENGAGLSITRARTLTSKGVDFEGKGLQPDVPAQGDALEAALRAMGAKA